jgi:hypothetical protein
MISYMRLHKMNPSLYKKKYIYGMACNKPKFQRSFFALSAIHRRRVFACEAQRYTIYHPFFFDRLGVVGSRATTVSNLYPIQDIPLYPQRVRHRRHDGMNMGLLHDVDRSCQMLLVSVVEACTCHGTFHPALSPADV